MSEIIIQVSLILLILLSPYFYGGVEIRSQSLIGLGIIFIFLVWLIKDFRERRGVLKTPLDLPLFLLLALAGLLTLFSVYRYLSLGELYRIITLVMLYFIVVNNINTERGVSLLILFLILGGVFYAGYGLLQYFGTLSNSFWTEKTSLASRYVNSNHFAGYLELVIPLCIGMGLVASKIWKKLLLTIFLIILIFAFILTKSRAAWLSLFLALIFSSFFLIQRRMISPKQLIFLSLLGIALIVVLFLGHLVIIERIKILAGSKYYSLFDRLNVWKGTLRMISHHPLGTGLGTFSVIFPQYRIHSDRFFVNYAHNEYLQVASELGIAGLGLLLWLGLRYFRVSLSFLKEKKDILFLSLLTSALALLIHSFFDFQLHIPTNAMLFSVIVGLTVGATRLNVRRGPSLTKRGITLTLIFSFLLAFALVVTYLADSHYRRGTAYEKNLHWNEAISEYKRAASLHPGNALYYERLGTIYALKETFAKDKETWRNRAIRAFQDSLKRNPYNSNSHINLAWLYEQDGQEDKALKEFEKAILYYPTDGRYHEAFAFYCLKNSLLERAFEEFRKGLELFTVEGGKTLSQILEHSYKYTQDYEMLKKIIPDEAEFHFSLAKFLEQKGRISEAELEFKRAKELSGMK